MAAGQGVGRIKNGIVRTFKIHEVSRGYVYLTMNKRLSEILDTEDFTAVLGDYRVMHRPIVNYGR